MSTNIFKLEAVRDLIVDKQPTAVVVADTNVVVGWPDFTKWKTSLGEVIFVLAAIINVELQILKSKNRDKEGCDPASVAARAFTELCKKGAIHRGTHVSGVGWFISVPIPMEDRMTPALKQWTFATQAYGSPDLMFLLLAMELGQLSVAPVVLATADNGLFGLASGHGVPAYHFRGFPMNDLGESLPEPSALSGLDWEQLKSAIGQAAKKDAVGADLTLTSKREIHRSFGQTAMDILNERPLPKDPLLLAEGVGTVHLDKEVPFSWCVSYSEWDYAFLCPDEGSPDEEGESQPFDPRPAFFTQVHVDFGGREDEVSDDIKRALEEKLEMLAFPLAGWLGMPTILDAESIIKFFLYITYLEESLSSKGGTEDDVKGEFAEEYRAASSLADFGAGTVFWRLGLDPEQSKVGDSLKKLLVALTASWSVGERIAIQLAI